MGSIGSKINTLGEYEQDEMCLVHAGEPTIAIDQNDEMLYGCNKCVFEKRL